MSDSIFTIRVVVLLLPGLLAAIIVERLTVHPKWEQFRFLLYSGILGCLSYIFLQLGLNGIKLIVAKARNIDFEPTFLGVWSSLFNKEGAIKVNEVALACFVALALGLGITAVVQYKLIYRFASWIGATNKYGDENLFTHFLNDRETRVIWVRDVSSDIVYEGEKAAYSEADNICEIVLRDVHVYRAGEDSPRYQLEKIYLSYRPGELVMEFPGSKELTDDRDEARTSN